MSLLPRDEIPLGRRGCVALGLWSLILLAGFAAAGRVSPDVRGFGTHQQFGLPPCSLRDRFGVPCPSCGMTTSVAHFVRGNWIQSARASTTGLLLACLCALQIPWCWISIWSRRLWLVSRPEWIVLTVLGSVYAVALTEWLIRLWRQ